MLIIHAQEGYPHRERPDQEKLTEYPAITKPALRMSASSRDFLFSHSLPIIPLLQSQGDIVAFVNGHDYNEWREGDHFLSMFIEIWYLRLTHRSKLGNFISGKLSFSDHPGVNVFCGRALTWEPEISISKDLSASLFTLKVCSIHLVSDKHFCKEFRKKWFCPTSLTRY